MTTKKKKKKASSIIKKKGRKTHSNGAHSPIEMDTRLEYVEQLFASFLRYRQVAAAIVEKYGVTHRTAENYIAKVYARWSKESEEGRPLRKRRAMERVREIGMRALNTGDNGAALRAAELLAKMEGVAPDQVVKIGGEITARVELGEDLEEVLGGIMKDPKLRKAVMKKIAPPREDKDHGKPSRRKGRRAKKDR